MASRSPWLRQGLAPSITTRVENGSVPPHPLTDYAALAGLPSSCHTLDRQAHRPGLLWLRKATRPSLRLHRVSKGRDVRGALLYGSLAIEGKLKAWKITRHKMARVSALARPDRSEWTRKSGATPTNVQEWRQNPPKKDQPKERGCTTMAIGRHWAEGRE